MQSINYAGNHLCHKEVGARKQKLPEEIKGGKKREEKRKKKKQNTKAAPHPQRSSVVLNLCIFAFTISGIFSGLCQVGQP